MFGVLDTDHYSAILHETPLMANLHSRIAQAKADVFTSIVTIQEITQGWTAEINRRKPGRDQLRAYDQFQNAIEDFASLAILRFDEDAAAAFHRLLSDRVRIGTMDLKIAAICISHSALLLTRNLTDFEKVPGLRVENWLD